MNLRQLLLFIAFCLSCKAAISEREPIDCTLAYSDPGLSQCQQVRYASEFPDCIAQSDISGHACIVMDTDLQFCDAQTSLPITAFFNDSNKKLDCANGAIDHGWGRISLPDGPATGVSRHPGIRLLDDTSLSDISVRNCTIRGTQHMGIKASRFFGGELGGDGVIGPDEPLPQGHSRLTFENLLIEDTVTGIFLGNFSDEVLISNVHIDNSDRIALYAEAGSHRIRLKDSIISNNQSREAVAIDSTYDSEISGTLFINNLEGAVNLYQNCGELKGIVCPVIRSTPPNNNVITGNTFVRNGQSALQIASRQGRNHTLGWCASLNGLPGKFTDTSENNQVNGNTFVCHEGTALKVHDGPNEIVDNIIVARHDCVPAEISTGGLGSASSDVLDGLVFRNNTIDAQRAPRLRNINPELDITFR